ncbi:MAG: lysophospholipid acyltransferase family protein [Pseudomonadota bacterium]
MPVFYPLFGIGCLWLLLLLALSAARREARGQQIRRLRAEASRISAAWLRLGARLGLLQHDVRSSAEPLAPGTIVIANHPSLVDVVFVLAELPQLCCVLKSDLRRVPVLGRLVRALNYLSNEDPERLLAEGEARLRAGESLLIFPEGTRTKGAPALSFKLAAIELALRTGATVQPVVIHYHGRYLSGLGRWYEMPVKRLHYRVEVITPVSPPLAPTAADRRRLRPRFKAALERGFEQRLNRFYPDQARFTRREPSSQPL